MYSHIFRDTFLDHHMWYKYMWWNNRNQKSGTDYIITNGAIHPREILDERTPNGASINSDQKFVMSEKEDIIPIVATK